MALMEVHVPDIGDLDEVTVIELLVKPGDSVAAEQSLITVESDKASMEIPSSRAGVVHSVSCKLGDKVKQGSLVAVLDVADAVPAIAPASAAATALPAAAVAVPAGAADARVPVGASAGSPGTGTIQVRVPDIGDFKDVSVIEVMVKPGDQVKLEQSLITVESDKASMEIPSSAPGLVRELHVKLGDKINVGDLMVVLDGPVGWDTLPPAAGTTVAAAVAVPAAVLPAAVAAPAAVLPAAVAGSAHTMPAHEPALVPTGGLPHASPSVRKFARELGVPLAELKGSGPKGRITETDVQAFTRSVMAGGVQTQAAASKEKAAANEVAAATDGAGLGLIPWPKVDFSKFGPIERRDMARIKKITAANLHRNWVMIPHVTNHDDADITELEAFRVSTNRENEKSGIKVTMLAFLIKAAVAALRKFPEFNASLDGEQLVLKQYYHIGFAADTPNGLMVPVVKDADKKGVIQISQEMGDLAKKARDGKLGPTDMSGACFTISSLGGIGGRYFTPIINAPEVAILGVCRSTTEPVWDGKAFVPRLMLPLSLSWDHRVIDGAAAARFNVYLGQILGDFRRVLL
ncbi:MAG: dihydrolipoyllysine-residue acetyltransferase [Rhodoferax sp.]|nr:dihydrolipoyllysine-residue acetyltransferase [Rhodoferax sp.]